MHLTSTDAIEDLDTLRRQLAERDDLIASQQLTLVYRQAKIDTLTAEIARLR